MAEPDPQNSPDSESSSGSVAAPSSSLPPEPLTPEELARLQACRVLIVDDDPAFLRFLQNLLERRSISTATAEDGAQALSLLDASRFDVILSDVQMPGLNGFQLLEAVRHKPDYALTPFILLTGKPAFEGVQTGLSRGADGYLPKPFSEEALFRAIHGALMRFSQVSQKAAAELDQIRTSLLSMLPHEFNTPLNGIFGVADLLEMGAASPEEIADCAQILRLSAERLLRLTTNFVLCAELRLQDSNPQLTSMLFEEPLSCPTTELESAALRRAQAAERSEDLHLQLAKATLRLPVPAGIKIFDELLDNAFKFSPHATPVTVRGRLEEQTYLFSIEDHGQTGIQPSDFERRGLFVQFNRQHFEQQGAGLGLYLAERLLHIYGGQLSFHATPGGGITVRFSVPVCEQPPAP